jgi:hypothetical protein
MQSIASLRRLRGKKDDKVLPSFMILPFPVRDQVIFALKPFGALNAVMSTQRRKVFWHLGRFVLREVFGGIKIGANLVEISTSSKTCQTT